jgi:polar amino acid transport system substrate-binding protein
MRMISLGVALTALALALAATATGEQQAQGQIPGCAKANLALKNEGRLTLATDNPAYPPWWGGGETRKPWKISNPYSGQGYESAVAYAVAKRLGFSKREVDWTVVPFGNSFRPGPKTFDFYMAQVSFSKDRERAVDFSSSYYYVKQSLVAQAGMPITRAKSLAALRPYRLGAQLGTTSYRYITDYIKPTQQPRSFDSNNLAIRALENGQIDGIVVDLPTAFYVTAAQMDDGAIVGQFPNRAGREQFGMVFETGSKLRRCVNKALSQLWANGTMKKIQTRWLARVGGAPELR